jgi:hypothetical protein
MHPVYKSGIWHTKLAFRFQICSFQFTNKHLALQTGASDYNSAYQKFRIFYCNANVMNFAMYLFYSFSRVL